MGYLVIALIVLSWSIGFAEDHSSLNQKYCSGNLEVFDSTIALPIDAPENLLSYLTSLQSDKIVDSVLDQYANTDAKKLPDATKVILASAIIRSSKYFPKNAIELLNFQSPNKVVEAYRLAILQGLQINNSGKGPVETFELVLDEIGSFDSSIFSQMIDVDLEAQTKKSISKKFLDQLNRLHDDDPYKIFLETKLNILKADNEIKLWTVEDRRRKLDGFRIAYEKCPVNQEFAIVYTQELLSGKEFEKAKSITERMIADHKYVSPWAHLYLLFAAYGMNDAKTVERQLESVNKRISWYSPYESKQIHHIEQNSSHEWLEIFKSLFGGLIVLILLIFSLKILRRR